MLQNASYSRKITLSAHVCLCKCFCHGSFCKSPTLVEKTTIKNLAKENATEPQMLRMSYSTSSSTLPLVQRDVVHGIVAQVLLRVNIEVLQVLRVHLTTPVPEENWHVRKLILCFQSLALGV